ncbi:MAG: hypothetical protein H7Y22_14300 [Gemmatimonadaceae bacterium]|nr:hypothetical protein [Gloeobacterales cyanobacterium ES-bin-141]
MKLKQLPTLLYPAVFLVKKNPALRYMLSIVALIVVCVLSLISYWQITAIFKDDFDRADPEPVWSASGWDVVEGKLHSDISGYGEVLTKKAFPQESYTLASSVKGLASGSAATLTDNIHVVFGADESGHGYRLAYYPSFNARLELSYRDAGASGEIQERVLASTSFKAEPESWYRLEIKRDGALGLIRIYLAKEGMAGTPLLEVVDNTSRALGHIGWGVERESPGEVHVDWVVAR